MKRLLCIVGSMNAGGAETFLMKLYREIDRSKYQFDFCVAEKQPGVYDNEIRSLGGNILYTTPKSKGMIRSFRSIKKIVAHNQYKYVMRVSQHSLSGVELIAAKAGGALVTIFRSSNTQTGGNYINTFLHYLFRPITSLIPDVKIAPSSEAAIFMFGKKAVKKHQAFILHNALNIHKYSFSQKVREHYRAAMDIGDSMVVGHIGRFVKQKNHEFLVKIFLNIKKQRENAILFLVGYGELEDKIRDIVEAYGLKNSVRFLGLRDDIPELLSVMDVFLFPSYFEGMPNTVIEAQASGLPCVLSDTITKEADITGLLKYESLNVSPEIWAKDAIEAAEKERIDTKQKLIQAGYDIESCTRKFESIVFE